MWQNAEASREIIHRLYGLDRTTPIFGRARKEEEICSLLARLVDCNDLAAVTCAARFLFSTSRTVRSLARQAIGTFIAGLSPLEILQLATVYPKSDGWEISDSLAKLSPVRVREVAAEPDEALNSAVIGLISIHRSGYIRHEAVRLLAEIGDGSELPFLLIRQNDWVAPVAEDARKAVESRVTDAYAPSLAKCLGLMFHLRSCTRRDHAGILQRTLELLLQERFDEALRAAIESAERMTRRAVIRLALEREGKHTSRVLRYGMSSNDPSVRLCCSQHLARIAGEPTVDSLLEQTLFDSFMPIRREGLRLQATRHPDRAIEVWTNTLVDKSSSIRLLARFSLGKLGVSDTRPLYRQAIAQSPDSLGAIEGLAEIAEPSDASIFRKFLKHPLPSRRRAAIRGLARSIGNAAVSELVRCLDDESPSVAREAQRLLASLIHLVDGDDLLKVVLDSRYSTARRAAIGLIADSGRWRCSLPWLIKAACHADADTRLEAERRIEEWFSPPQWNRVFTRPTESERRAIREALLESKGLISQQVIQLFDREPKW